jgi:Flp pilus assembly pilin Flp
VPSGFLRWLQAESSRRLDQRGASTVEYAILIGVIVAMIFAAVGILGGSLGEVFSGITDLLPDM